MTTRAVVIGVGHYLPERVVPNSEFEKSLDTSDEWIRTRSGIERRHFATEDETTSMLGAKALRNIGQWPKSCAHKSPRSKPRSWLVAHLGIHVEYAHKEPIDETHRALRR